MVSEIASIETFTDAPVLTARAWSPQQQAIFGWFQDCRGHLIVEAGPGSGKTTVIVEGITHAPEARIVVCAFNKRIQAELAVRLTNPAAEAKTFHGIGFAIARQFWPGVSVARDRVRVTSLVNAVCDASVPGPIQRLVGTLLTLARWRRTRRRSASSPIWRWRSTASRPRSGRRPGGISTRSKPACSTRWSSRRG